ncbi:MAG: sulfite exporter TauE/SafE family protein [Candidatus Electryonea clarkiae]|nr:sulfite exporter TauE/SafE family protein [Candidatus Electryonea clarkiae]
MTELIDACELINKVIQPDLHDMITFPISGVETFWWLPFLVMAFISSLTSIGGLSGAFILLPFQMTILGFTSPAVTPTNFLFNVVAIPSGVYRYIREGRMVWCLTWVIVLGTLPGIFAGGYIRIMLLPDAGNFKLFVALVLAYISSRLLRDIISNKDKKPSRSDKPFIVENSSISMKKIQFDFIGNHHEVSTPAVFFLSLGVGVIGGVYGIGGGAIIAPFLVTIFRLPVHTIAGATLFGTFVSSVVGVLFYTSLGVMYASTGMSIQPDWALGAMLGLGGAVGMYFGARSQRFLPSRLIKMVILGSMMFVVVKYVIEFLQR